MPAATSWLMKRIGNRLWMGNNLAWLDLRDNSYHPLDIPDSFKELRGYSIYDMQQAGEYLWMMGESGVYRMDAETHITDRYWSGGEGDKYLPCDDFRHLYQESDSSWWFATASGLLHLNPQNHNYRLYSTADGLPNNKCHAVIPDENGFLWVSSDNGIIQFEKSTGRLRVYSEKDGLGLNEFNRLSYYKDTEGTLYFGGINGGVSFHPRTFAKAFETSPKVHLVVTECSLSGKRSLSEKDLRAAYLTNGNIEIDPSYPSLRLRFALTDYTQPQKTVYRYKIDDAQEWQEMKDGELQLTGLSYGAHTLHVFARTMNGFTAPETQIRLIVLRPFYLKLWFLITILLLLAGGWGVYKKRYRPAIPSGHTAAQQTFVESETTPTQPALFPITTVAPERKVHMPKQDDSAFLERLEGLVLQHLEDVEFDAEALGKAVGLSTSQLHRRLTTLTGLSSGRYIYSVRLREAMRRIVQTKLTISEIAYQTGFSDPAYFTRLFTRTYQHPPSYFREPGS
jgi:AraC-like DNA-binding protein